MNERCSVSIDITAIILPSVKTFIMNERGVASPWFLWQPLPDTYTCVEIHSKVSDSKMQRIRELRAKFEEDKKRIHEMRQQRKFKPY